MQTGGTRVQRGVVGGTVCLPLECPTDVNFLRFALVFAVLIGLIIPLDYNSRSITEFPDAANILLESAAAEVPASRTATLAALFKALTAFPSLPPWPSLSTVLISNIDQLQKFIEADSNYKSVTKNLLERTPLGQDDTVQRKRNCSQ